jgi:hypothetical protein
VQGETAPVSSARVPAGLIPAATHPPHRGINALVRNQSPARPKSLARLGIIRPAASGTIRKGHAHPGKKGKKGDAALFSPPNLWANAIKELRPLFWSKSLASLGIIRPNTPGTNKTNKKGTRRRDPELAGDAVKELRPFFLPEFQTFRSFLPNALRACAKTCQAA